jgi:hypothetical protein
MDKAGLFALFKKMGDCKRTMMENCSPVEQIFKSPCYSDITWYIYWGTDFAESVPGFHAPAA